MDETKYLKDIYIERLNKMLDLLESNGLQPMLLCGTLLAFIREGEPFVHDYADIDIAVSKKDYWKVRALIDSHPEFEYYRVWRNEIAVHFRNKKIDIFFLETDEKDNLYIYSYKRNSFTGKYDTEWRTVFNAKDFYPLQRVDYPFLNRKVYIPFNSEKILTTHYGDWKTPNSKWTIAEMTNIDSEHRQIGFIIPSFLRPEKTKKCIESIYKLYPREWFRIHLGNQEDGVRPEYLQKDDKFYVLPMNSGLAKTRQYLIDQSKEPLLVIMDDDFLFTKESNLNTFIQILLDKEHNGIVGGQLKNYNYHPIFSYLYDIEYTKDSIKKVERNREEIKTFKSKSQIEEMYNYGDLILNFAMAKREFFQSIRYDEKFKLVEHLDFYLRLKKNGNWKVTFTPNVFAEHQNEDSSDEYNHYRHWQNGLNVKLGFQRFKEKWGIDLNDVETVKLEKNDEQN